MSTELVAIERINIKKDNGDADSLRSCLAHYLQQFLDSASIESMTLHELTIKIDGESVLDVSDKTGGVGLSGLDKDWQHTETVHKAIEQIILDADVEVFLSYDMIHYFSNKNFYGSAFWMDTLQEFGCEAVRYHGLEYYSPQVSEFRSKYTQYNGMLQEENPLITADDVNTLKQIVVDAYDFLNGNGFDVSTVDANAAQLYRTELAGETTVDNSTNAAPTPTE